MTNKKNLEKMSLPALTCSDGHVVYGDLEYVGKKCPVCEKRLIFVEKGGDNG